MADTTWEKFWRKDLCEKHVWKRRVQAGEAAAEIIVRELIEEVMEQDYRRVYGSIGFINKELLEDTKESEPALFDEIARLITGFFGLARVDLYGLCGLESDRGLVLSDLKKYLDAYFVKRMPELKEMEKKEWGEWGK